MSSNNTKDLDLIIDTSNKLIDTLNSLDVTGINISLLLLEALLIRDTAIKLRNQQNTNT